MDFKNGFLMYKDWQTLINALNVTQKAILLDSIFNYHCNGELPNLSNDKHLKGVFDFFMSTFQRDSEKYKKKCEKLRQNGSKKANATKCYQLQAIAGDNDKDNDNDNDNDKAKENANVYDYEKRKKAKRHKYGEYKNVLLSDNEIEKLKETFPFDYKEKIEYMSAAIEMKGYKYKNHYLALLKWATNDKNNKPGDNSSDSIISRIARGEIYGK